MADAPLYTFIDSTGVIVPDTADIKSQVQAEFRAALGADLDLADSTPQGIMITGETASRRSVAENNAALANQINPNEAGGVFLDGICALTGLKRDRATYTVVPGVTVTGVARTIIPTTAIAQTAAGDQFRPITAVTIPDSGMVTADFVAVVAGAVPCPAGALTKIVSAVLGWESINNAAAGVIGQDQQKDQPLRAKRRNTLALQGISLSEAITSALYSVPGVTSLQYRENFTDAAELIDGINLVRHSLWACVRGGTDSDLAAALLRSKSGGCGMNGATVVNVVDQFSGQSCPITFDRPAELPIMARITVRASSALIDYQAAVRDAIASWCVMAPDGMPGIRTGVSVSPFDISNAVAAGTSGILVSKVELSTVAANAFAIQPVTVALNQIASLSASNITVVSS